MLSSNSDYHTSWIDIFEFDITEISFGFIYDWTWVITMISTSCAINDELSATNYNECFAQKSTSCIMKMTFL